MGHLTARSGSFPGIFNAASGYRKKGHEAIAGMAARRKVYEYQESIARRLKGIPELGIPAIAPRKPGLPTGSTDHVKGYLFGTGDNFKTGKVPYRNQAHHLVPRSTFLTLFSARQREVLLRVPYDINNGKNIMFLPERMQDSYFSLLPYHSGDHRAYSNQVKRDAATLSKNLGKYLSQGLCEDARDPGQEIADKLMQLQDEYWNVLKNSGPKTVAVVGRAAESR